jgi:hypothetical protein
MTQAHPAAEPTVVKSSLEEIVIAACCPTSARAPGAHNIPSASKQTTNRNRRNIDVRNIKRTALTSTRGFDATITLVRHHVNGRLDVPTWIIRLLADALFEVTYRTREPGPSRIGDSNSERGRLRE